MLESSNDVFSVLGASVGKVIDTAREVKLAKINAAAAKTQAAPSGNPGWNTFNPFPGMFGAYPQAEGKTQPGAGFNVQAAMPMLLIIGAVVLLLALVRR